MYLLCKSKESRTKTIFLPLEILIFGHEIPFTAVIHTQGGDDLPGDVEGWGKVRFLVAFVSFWAFLCNYALRININLAIVEMANGTTNSGNGSASDECGWAFDDLPGDEGTSNSLSMTVLSSTQVDGQNATRPVLAGQESLTKPKIRSQV